MLEIAQKNLTALQTSPRAGVIAALPTISEGGQQLVARSTGTDLRALLALKPSPLVVLRQRQIFAP